MPSVRIALHISADALLRHYRGEAREVRATTHDGRSILFPAAALRAVVEPDGVYGEFALHFDAQHRFVAIERLRRA